MHDPVVRFNPGGQAFPSPRLFTVKFLVAGSDDEI